MNPTLRVALGIVALQGAAVAGALALWAPSEARTEPCHASLGAGYVEYRCESTEPERPAPQPVATLKLEERRADTLAVRAPSGGELERAPRNRR